MRDIIYFLSKMSIINHIKIYNNYDTETSMPNGEPLGATCVQRSDDSRNSAIRTAYRTSLRSSSIWEPRYPSLKIFYYLFILKKIRLIYVLFNIISIGLWLL